MYISETQQRIMDAIQKAGILHEIRNFVVTKGANRGEMTDAYHVALWLEGAPKLVKWEFINWAAGPWGDCGLRVCDNCEKFMIEGYILGDEYACSDECAVALFQDRTGKTLEESRKDLTDILDEEGYDYFWTEWESNIQEKAPEAKTLKDILEDYYTGEPEIVAEGHLEDFLMDLDEAGAFRNFPRSWEEMMDSLRNNNK